MTQQEINAIRARCETVGAFYDPHWDKFANQMFNWYSHDIKALLDALVEMQFDRDDWKWRAEALEVAVKQYAACETCSGGAANGQDTGTCCNAIACTLAGWKPDAWTFDAERFSGSTDA